MAAVLAFAIPWGAHAAGVSTEMWAGKGLTLPMLIDRDGLVAQGYGIKALPTTVVLDARGVVELIKPGLDPGKLERLIRRS